MGLTFSIVLIITKDKICFIGNLFKNLLEYKRCMSKGEDNKCQKSLYLKLYL